VFDQPPTERPAHQPWPTMPMVFKLSSSHEEGGEVQYLANTIKFEDDGNGNVSGLQVAKTQFGENGSIGAEPGSERLLPADLVLLAIGFRHPDTETLKTQLGLDLNPRGNVARTPDFAATKPAFFVCGDAGRGQSLVVWAIAEGRSCAAAVDTYLQGHTELPAPIRANTTPLTLAS
jgi:glutamate synthase (NADPH) small chain